MIGEESNRVGIIRKKGNMVEVTGKEGNNGNMMSRYIGATVAIVAMWLAVLFAGLFGPDFVVSHGTTVNTGAMLAPFAMGGTIAVAINGYRS